MIAGRLCQRRRQRLGLSLQSQKCSPEACCLGALQYRSPLAGLNASEAMRMKQLGVLDDVAYSNGACSAGCLVLRHRATMLPPGRGWEGMRPVDFHLTDNLGTKI